MLFYNMKSVIPLKGSWGLTVCTKPTLMLDILHESLIEHVCMCQLRMFRINYTLSEKVAKYQVVTNSLLNNVFVK